MSMEAAWNDIAQEAARLKDVSIRDLFAADAQRFEGFTASLDDLMIDYSKEKVDAGAMAALIALAKSAGVEGARDAMFSGAVANVTEGRRVLHMALRGSAAAPEGEDIDGTLDRFLGFAEDVREGRYAAVDGAPFSQIVAIGIGGSDLGPAMAAQALFPDCDGPQLHFVSNVDGAHITDVLKPLGPKRTLVIVASKTFTTQETMANAETAKSWLAGEVAAPGHHMAAVSANVPACGEFGIDASRVFGFWDWVGGRYSLWSSIGLPIALGIGADGFRAFLKGAQDLDRHFCSAPIEQNLPILFGLIGVWRRNAMGWPTVALIPYDQRLARFPAYVQQLDMESNGKRVSISGAPVTQATGPVIFGEPGTNAQHSFFQLLHQGTDIVPVDFIVAANAREDVGEHHALLLANCFAQGQALAFGRTEEEVRGAMSDAGIDPEEIDRLAPHRTFPGNRPTTTILHDRLDPYALGRLIALFEHKVFVQGIIWGINSFDQWGVELGKELARALGPAMSGGDLSDLDSSTRGLVSTVLAKQQK